MDPEIVRTIQQGYAWDWKVALDLFFLDDFSLLFNPLAPTSEVDDFFDTFGRRNE